MFELNNNRERNLLIDLAWILLAIYLLYSIPSRSPHVPANPVDPPWMDGPVRPKLPNAINNRNPLDPAVRFENGWKD